MENKKKKPDWLKVKYNQESVDEIANLMKDLRLNTVCKEASCPNMGECYKKHTATFMLLGSNCTRNCKFCNVTDGKPQLVDKNEPENVAQAVKKLKLKHVVITSVTRDDLEDGGAMHFAKTIQEIRKVSKDVTVEVLIPDLQMNKEALDSIIEAKPEVLNHNLETIKEFQEEIRPQANYERSLNVLSYCKEKDPSIITKTGFMLGFGETNAQVEVLMDDILATGCNILTIGQYLQPSKDHIEMVEYASLEDFKRYKDVALEKGFLYVASGPFVRSSYEALDMLEVCNDLH